MASINFQLLGKKDVRNIYIVFSNGRSCNFKKNSGKSIHKNQWSEKRQVPKPTNPENKRLNESLMDLKNFVLKQFNNTDPLQLNSDWLQLQIDIFNGKVTPEGEENKPEPKYLLTEAIQNYIDTPPAKKTTRNYMERSPATLQKYRTLKKKVQHFESYKKYKYEIKDVDLVFKDDFYKYLTKVEMLGKNVVERYIIGIKTVCTDAKIKNPKIETSENLIHLGSDKTKVDKVFLTFKEITRIEKTPMFSQYLENAKDWLIIGCYIGQRVSDLLELTSDNIVKVDGIFTIELTQKKTGKKVIIPVTDPIEQILNKRNGQFPRKISDQKFNEYIKEVCRIAGISEIVQGDKIVNVTPKNKKPTYRKVKGNYPKHELVTSHICRRSFATNYYGLMLTSLIICITGHSTEKQFLEYVGKPPADHVKQTKDIMNLIHEKLNEELRQAL